MILQQALACYGLEEAPAVFLQHNENLTYRVADKFLLRIHSPAPGIHAPCTISQRRAELAFLAHLRSQGIPVQEPMPTLAGDSVAILSDGTAATLLRWLPGDVIPREQYSGDMCFHVGEMTAQLHQAAHGFTHPDLRCYDQADVLAKSELLTAMAHRHRLGVDCAVLLRAACETLGQSLAASPDTPIAIHNDLSTSNILQTPSGPVPIDFSLCGMGLPMTDLGMLLASFSSTAQRSAIVRGYAGAGGVIRHRELEAGFIYGLLGAFVFHADSWPLESWFPARMRRWEKEMLHPFALGKSILDDQMNFIYLPKS